MTHVGGLVSSPVRGRSPPSVHRGVKGMEVKGLSGLWHVQAFRDDSGLVSSLPGQSAPCPSITALMVKPENQSQPGPTICLSCLCNGALERNEMLRTECQLLFDTLLSAGH